MKKKAKDYNNNSVLAKMRGEISKSKVLIDGEIQKTKNLKFNYAIMSKMIVNEEIKEVPVDVNIHNP